MTLTGVELVKDAGWLPVVVAAEETCSELAAELVAELAAEPVAELAAVVETPEEELPFLVYRTAIAVWVKSWVTVVRAAAVAARTDAVVKQLSFIV